MGLAMWDKLWQMKPELIDDAHPSLDAMLARIRGRNTVVLAGDHSGTFADTLSAFFKDVYVFEPRRTSYCCVKINTVKAYNVYTAPKALSNTTSLGSFIGNKLVEDRMGVIYMTELDALKLDALDALVIDKGQNVNDVLSGAAGKIKRFHPVIFTEYECNVLGYRSYPLNGEWVVHTLFGGKP